MYGSRENAPLLGPFSEPRRSRQSGSLRTRLAAAAAAAVALTALGCISLWNFALMNPGYDPLNADLRISVLTSVNDKDLLEGITAGFEYWRRQVTLEQEVCTNEQSCHDSFVRLHKYNATNFIINIDSFGLLAICKYVKLLRTSINIVSVSDVPTGCQGYIKSVQRPIQPFLHALATKVTSMALRYAFVFVEKDDLDSILTSSLNDTLLKANIKPNIIIIPNKVTIIDKWRITLDISKYPNAAILFVRGSTYFKVASAMHDSPVFNGRVILSHLDPFYKDRILKNEAVRKLSEKVYLLSASQVYQASIESSILKNEKMVPNLQKLVGLKALGLLINSNPKRFARLKYDDHNIRITVERFIPRSLMSSFFFQCDPWFIESIYSFGINMTSVEVSDNWGIDEIYNLTYKIYTRQQLKLFASQESCNLKDVTVSANDPFWGTPVSLSKNFSSLPSVLVIPISNSRGFSLKLLCEADDAVGELELGCFGEISDRPSIECAVTKSFAHGHRVIRSYRYQPYNYEEDDGDKKKSKIDRFMKILPQVAACIGTAGFCTFCYLFLLYVPIPAAPTVCYGSCAAGIGGSCASLIGIGIKTSYESTVICSELFQQGYINSLSYMADGRYGAKLTQTYPLAIKGYHLTAKPIVQLMRMSPKVTDYVYEYALPWIRHMEYTEGVLDTDDQLGSLMTEIGIPLLSLIGLLLTYFHIIFLLVLFILILYR